MAISMVQYFDDHPDTAAALAPVAGIPLFRRTVGTNGFWPAYLIGVGVPWIRTRLSKKQVVLP